MNSHAQLFITFLKTILLASMHGARVQTRALAQLAQSTPAGVQTFMLNGSLAISPLIVAELPSIEIK